MEGSGGPLLASDHDTAKGRRKRLPTRVDPSREQGEPRYLRGEIPRYSLEDVWPAVHERPNTVLLETEPAEDRSQWKQTANLFRWFSVGRPCAMTWDCLRLAGIEDTVPGYACLFELDCVALGAVIERETYALRALKAAFRSADGGTERQVSRGRVMRILLVNGNTSDEVTDTLAGVARDAAGPDTEIISATGTFGVRLIGHRAEAAIAEHAVLERIAERADTVDGVVIGVSGDTALRAARAMVDVPVVGMTEAAMLMACMLGGRFGLITFSTASIPLYWELVKSHGLMERAAGMRTIDVTFAQAFGERDSMTAPIVEAAEALISEDSAETLILVGAAGAGLPAKLQSRVAVPLLDGITCGVLLVEALIRLGAPVPTTGSYVLPPGNLVKGLSGALTSRLKEPGS